MSSFIRSISGPAEVVLITLICFGAQTVWAVRVVVRHWKHTVPNKIQIDNVRVFQTVTLELLCLPIALWVGSIRGWSLATFGLRFSWKDTVAGLLLFAALMAASALFGTVLRAFWGKAVFTSILPGAALPLVILLSIVNPLYEEIFEAGYFTHALQGLGMWPTVLASALFVSFLHAYLVLPSVMLIFLTRIVLGLAYWRWRQLWPLVVAHSLCDLLGFLGPRLSGEGLQHSGPVENSRT